MAGAQARIPSDGCACGETSARQAALAGRSLTPRNPAPSWAGKERRKAWPRCAVTGAEPHQVRVH